MTKESNGSQSPPSAESEGKAESHRVLTHCWWHQNLSKTSEAQVARCLEDYQNIFTKRNQDSGVTAALPACPPLLFGVLYSLPELVISVDKQRPPTWEWELLIDSKSKWPSLPAFGRDSTTGRRSGKAFWWPKGKVHPDGRLLKPETDWGRERQEKMSLNTFLYQKARKCSKNDGDTSKEHRSQPKSSPTDHMWPNLSIIKNNELCTLDFWLYAFYASMERFTKTTTATAGKM